MGNLKLQEMESRLVIHTTTSTSDEGSTLAPGEVDMNDGDKFVMKAKRSVDHYGHLQEISKCCPEGLTMDDWYKCVKNMDVGQDMFADELLEVGAKDKEMYVIVHNKEWERCPIRQRKEFEVLHIPHDKNKTVYVFVDIEIDYDITSEKEINFDGFRELKYSCLEVGKDLQSITALVCANKGGEEDKRSFIRKCCPKGQGLTRNFSSCAEIDHQWIAPRAVLDHKTEKMTGSYQLISDHGLCGADDILTVETAHAVTTDGLFMPASKVNGPQA